MKSKLSQAHRPSPLPEGAGGNTEFREYLIHPALYLIIEAGLLIIGGNDHGLLMLRQGVVPVFIEHVRHKDHIHMNDAEGGIFDKAVILIALKVVPVQIKGIISRIFSCHGRKAPGVAFIKPSEPVRILTPLLFYVKIYPKQTIQKRVGIKKKAVVQGRVFKEPFENGKRKRKQSLKLLTLGHCAFVVRPVYRMALPNRSTGR